MGYCVIHALIVYTIQLKDWHSQEKMVLIFFKHAYKRVMDEYNNINH